MGNPSVITDSEPTKVVLRRFRDDDSLIALFPEVSTDVDGTDMQSYQHVGQHGPASYPHIIEATKPVLWWDKEVLALLEELKQRGYNPDVRQRATESMHRARFAEAKRLRQQLEAEAAAQPDASPAYVAQ